MMRPAADRRTAHAQAQESLTLDILTGLLGRVSAPAALGDYLTGQMRELTGTRTVVLLQYSLPGVEAEPRVVHVSPQRRGAQMVPALCGRFAHYGRCGRMMSPPEEPCPGLVSLAAGPAEARAALEALGCRNGFAMPLNVASLPVGALLFFDLPDAGERIPEVISLLAPLSTVVALALRNALLFEQQEAAIEERTRQIRESEASKAELQQRLSHAQRMEAIGRLAGGIAHDFNNVLTPILAHAELVITQLPPESPLREDLDAIGKAATRARDMVRQILAFSRQEQQPRQLVEVAPLVHEALRLLRATLPTTIEIEEQLDPRAGHVHALPGEIYQVLMNLGTNAMYAMRDRGGTLRVTLEAPTRECIHLAVADTGHGMDSGTLERIFDPYFTTKPTGEGTGLGLAVVHGIVNGCGGTVRVTSEAGKGSVFHVYFPRQADAGTSLAEASPTARPAGNARVLFVDDEPAIASLGRKILANLGYSVTALTGSAEALALFRQDPSAFDLVITDYTLPRMTGARLTTEILAVRRDMPVIICTGFSETLDEQKARELGARALLMKPFTIQALADAVREVLETAYRRDAEGAEAP